MNTLPTNLTSTSAPDWALAFVSAYPVLEADAVRISFWFAHAIAAGYAAAESGLPLHDTDPPSA